MSFGTLEAVPEGSHYVRLERRSEQLYVAGGENPELLTQQLLTLLAQVSVGAAVAPRLGLPLSPLDLVKRRRWPLGNTKRVPGGGGVSRLRCGIYFTTLCGDGLCSRPVPFRSPSSGTALAFSSGPCGGGLSGRWYDCGAGALYLDLYGTLFFFSRAVDEDVCSRAGEPVPPSPVAVALLSGSVSGSEGSKRPL